MPHMGAEIRQGVPAAGLQKSRRKSRQIGRLDLDRWQLPHPSSTVAPWSDSKLSLGAVQSVIGHQGRNFGGWLRAINQKGPEPVGISQNRLRHWIYPPDAALTVPLILRCVIRRNAR